MSAAPARVSNLAVEYLHHVAYPTIGDGETLSDFSQAALARLCKKNGKHAPLELRRKKGGLDGVLKRGIKRIVYRRLPAVTLAIGQMNGWPRAEIISKLYEYWGEHLHDSSAFDRLVVKESEPVLAMSYGLLPFVVSAFGMEKTDPVDHEGKWVPPLDTPQMHRLLYRDEWVFRSVEISKLIAPMLQIALGVCPQHIYTVRYNTKSPSILQAEQTDTD